MGLRFQCGRHPNDGFKITDSETGADLTQAILPSKVDVLVSMRPDEMNKVRLEVYAEGVDVISDHAEVKIVNPDGTRGDLPWRDFDTETLWNEICNLQKQVRGLADTLKLLLSRTVETELTTKAVRTRLIDLQEAVDKAAKEATTEILTSDQ
jgi:hypothetical protein